MFNKLFIFATASVALIILFDIATGQGPAGLNSYLGPPPREYLVPPPPPPQVIQPISYMPRGEYDLKRLDKSGKNKYENDDEKEDKYLAKSYEKEDNKEYEKGYKSNTTPSPGVFSSFSNSMSDAWKSLTTLGRQSRSIPQRKTVQLIADVDGTKSIRKPII